MSAPRSAWKSALSFMWQPLCDLTLTMVVGAVRAYRRASVERRMVGCGCLSAWKPGSQSRAFCIACRT
eukprot:863321-Rhodomonas_salina.1